MSNISGKNTTKNKEGIMDRRPSWLTIYVALLAMVSLFNITGLIHISWWYIGYSLIAIALGIIALYITLRLLNKLGLLDMTPEEVEEFDKFDERQ